MLASPPPWAACSSTAAVRISESRMRMTTRTVYMRGARYLGCAGAHKLGPAVGIERRAADEYTIQLRFGQQLGDVLQIHASAVEDSDDAGRVLREPGADLLMDLRGVLRRRVAAREIGRASCRERVGISEDAVSLNER